MNTMGDRRRGSQKWVPNSPLSSDEHSSADGTLAAPPHTRQGVPFGPIRRLPPDSGWPCLQCVLRRCHWFSACVTGSKCSGVPAGIDAATVMELLAVWDRTPYRTPEELPAEPVGVAVLCLGDAAGCGRPGEQPAGAELRMGRPKDREVNQAFQLGATSLAWLGHGGECMTRPGHSRGARPPSLATAGGV
jgi:hypothetical protein